MSEKSQVEFFDLVRKLSKKDYRILVNLIKSRDRLNEEINALINKLGMKQDAMETSQKEEDRRDRKEPTKRRG